MARDEFAKIGTSAHQLSSGRFRCLFSDGIDLKKIVFHWVGGSKDDEK